MMQIRILSENRQTVYDKHTDGEGREGQMIAKGNGICENKRIFSTSKEEVKMINTGKFKMYGQLEDQADTGDIEAFVFRNGEVVPTNQVETSTGPVIHTAPEKNYGQMEDIAKGNADVEDFVYKEGRVVPVSQAENSSGPVIHTAPEKNYAQPEGRDEANLDVKICNRTTDE